MPDSPENNFATLTLEKYGQSIVVTFSEGNLKCKFQVVLSMAFGTMAYQIASQVVFTLK